MFRDLLTCDKGHLYCRLWSSWRTWGRVARSQGHTVPITKSTHLPTARIASWLQLCTFDQSHQQGPLSRSWVPDSESSVQLRLALADFSVEVPRHCISAPGLVVERGPPLGFRVPHGVFHHLKRHRHTESRHQSVWENAIGHWYKRGQTCEEQSKSIHLKKRNLSKCCVPGPLLILEVPLKGLVERWWSRS